MNKPNQPTNQLKNNNKLTKNQDHGMDFFSSSFPSDFGPMKSINGQNDRYTHPQLY